MYNIIARILNRNTNPAKHRRQKISLGRLFRYVLYYIDSLMYYVGATAERGFKNIFRKIRKFLSRIATFVGMILDITLGTLIRGIAAFLKDIIAPFVKLFTSIRSYVIVMSDPRFRDPRLRAMRRKQFFRYGWLWNKGLFNKMLNSILPFVSLAVCVYVVYTAANLNYVLSVSHNGQIIGYVENENIYDSAQRILQRKVLYAEDNTAWSAEATLGLAVVDQSQLATQDMMADTLLDVSGTEITDASGLYIGGEFYGATTAKDLMLDAIDAYLQPHKDAVATYPGTTVRFIRDVEMVDGIYPESSVVTFEELVQVLNTSTERDIYYTAIEGEVVEQIATKNGMTVETLRLLNPTLTTDVIETGTQLLVAENEPLLGVKTVLLETSNESIPFTTNVIKDPRYYVGYTQTIIPGKTGVRQVTTEVEYQNGVVIGRNIIEEVVISEPVAQEVVEGVKQFVGEGQSEKLQWPTGTYQRVSRGWIPGYHLGIDIAAVQGTPIYAAESGIVTVSSWSFVGYGNYVQIDHGEGFETLYAHNVSNVVSAGDVVSRGQLIAYVGTTGNSTGPHLHFEVRVDGERVPTEPYLYD